MNTINENFDIIHKYSALKKLTPAQIELYNAQAKTAKILLVFQNTKGLKTEDLEKLDENIVISITGGLDPNKKKKFDHPYYQRRTYYTPNEVVAIIKIFENIESKINPEWSELEKAMFVYQELYKCLVYDELEMPWNRATKENYEDWENQRKANRGKPIHGLKYSLDERTILRCDRTHNLLGLITGGAVCAGFALIYKEAMDRIGITCHYQNRTSGHCWNILEINGEAYGVDLSDELSLKNRTYRPNNECPFLMFGRLSQQPFYHVKDRPNHRNLDREDPTQESEYKVKPIELSELERMRKKINEETYIIAGHKITIKNNIPITEDPLMTFVRDDKTVFVLIPTGNEQNGLYEYMYIEYDAKNKQMQTSTIYSETKIQSFNLELRAAIANKLLSKERVEYRINKYNGYVGCLKNNKSVLTNYNIDCEYERKKHKL